MRLPDRIARIGLILALLTLAWLASRDARLGAAIVLIGGGVALGHHWNQHDGGKS